MLNGCKRFLLLFNFFIVSVLVAAVGEASLRNGDIVFIRSKSSQSKALQEVTGSIWTHVGIALRVDYAPAPTKVVDNTQEGDWVVVHSGGPVRFDTYKDFLAFGTQSTVKRLQEGVSFLKAEALYKKALPFVKKQTPYDIYFTNDPGYCSGFVNLVYKEALGISLAERIKIGDLKLNGPEAKKIIDQRFQKVRAPMTFEQWKTKSTIMPVTLFNSQLLIDVR